MYFGQVFDLLNGSKQCDVLENADNDVAIRGLSEQCARDAEQAFLDTCLHTRLDACLHTFLHTEYAHV